MDMPRRWIMYSSTRVGPGPMVEEKGRISIDETGELSYVLYDTKFD